MKRRINTKNTLIRVLITGANGFIGKNLLVHMKELINIKIYILLRNDNDSNLTNLISKTDVVIHLAGENRPKELEDFKKVNVDLTDKICNSIRKEFAKTNRKIKFILASSAQAEQNNEYGISKLLAEQSVQSLSNDLDIPVTIFRFPGVFGKWCKPNYNSVVATFCDNIVKNLPTKIRDPDFVISLVYIDDVVNKILEVILSKHKGVNKASVKPEYKITLGNLAKQIKAFKTSRINLTTELVGNGLTRGLYATYLSYLPKINFSYKVSTHKDERGIFVEMLKTNNSGQFSFFSAHPGITRGEHYHHTKSEKFLVIKGDALFRFRHIITNEIVQFRTNGETPEIVDTIPGWAHNVTNIGKSDLFVLLWANENFDRTKPDTIASKV